MHTSLQDAIDGRPWSVAAVVRDLELILDDEGRPLSERRAPSVVKEGVPMVLKACPYHDERAGVSMNVSALAQITRHLDDVLHDVAVFRAGCAPGPPRWRDVLAAVVDQLAGPARHLLCARDPVGPVPARAAVGHKLAAGYYGVVRSLIRHQALGEPRPVTVPGLLGFVTEQRALLGASEACAGPPAMIERVSNVLLHGDPRVTRSRITRRERLAELLTTQILLGVAWELFDGIESRELLFGTIGRARMTPRNPFMAQVLDGHVRALREQGWTRPRRVEFGELVPVQERALRSMLAESCGEGRAVPGPAVAAVVELYAHGEGAVILDDLDHVELLAERLVRYLSAMHELRSALWKLERELRAELDYPLAVEVRFEPTVLPTPRALAVFEAIVGHRLQAAPGPDAAPVLRNHRRSITLPRGAA